MAAQRGVKVSDQMVAPPEGCTGSNMADVSIATCTTASTVSAIPGINHVSAVTHTAQLGTGSLTYASVPAGSTTSGSATITNACVTAGSLSAGDSASVDVTAGCMTAAFSLSDSTSSSATVNSTSACSKSRFGAGLKSLCSTREHTEPVSQLSTQHMRVFAVIGRERFDQSQTTRTADKLHIMHETTEQDHNPALIKRSSNASDCETLSALYQSELVAISVKAGENLPQRYDTPTRLTTFSPTAIINHHGQNISHMNQSLSQPTVCGSMIDPLRGIHMSSQQAVITNNTAEIEIFVDEPVSVSDTECDSDEIIV